MPVTKTSTARPRVNKLTRLRVVSTGILRSLLPVLSALMAPVVVQAANVDGDQIILECGAGATDEIALAECVALKFEQAEVTLAQAEESWQRLLDSGQQPQADVQATAELPDDDAEPTAATVPESGNVIAIVNDTALQSGVSITGGQVINIDSNNESFAADEEENFDTSIEMAERFGFLPALFRSYRDQHCAWQSNMFGVDRQNMHYQACLASMSQARARNLTHSLARQRARQKSGNNYRGYYVKTGSGALFQSCDRKTEWQVSGTDQVLAALDARYLDLESQSLTNSDLLYAELYGDVAKPSDNDSVSEFSAVLSVRSVSLLRPVAQTDCNSPAVLPQGLAAVPGLPDTSNAVDESSDAATVDDYASSGFLYGYFNYWIAACSVTENNVCSAETEAQFASDGDWQLRVDRSLESDWRIMLIPTTDDQLIEKKLSIQINGADLYLGKSFEQPLRLTMRQGVEIANGELARELIAKIKQGRELRFQWFDESDVMSELKFSLLGVTRALQYFDSEKS